MIRDHLLTISRYLEVLSPVSFVTIQQRLDWLLNPHTPIGGVTIQHIPHPGAVVRTLDRLNPILDELSIATYLFNRPNFILSENKLNELLRSEVLRCLPWLRQQIEVPIVIPEISWKTGRKLWLEHQEIVEQLGYTVVTFNDIHHFVTITFDNVVMEYNRTASLTELGRFSVEHYQLLKLYSTLGFNILKYCIELEHQLNTHLSLLIKHT